MPLVASERAIDGHTWTLNTLPATKGIACLAKIAGLLGAPVGAVTGSITGAAKSGKTKGATPLLERELDGKTLGDALGALMERLDQPGTVDLIKTLVSGLHKDSRPVNFDLEFAGNYGVLAEIVAWALQENFGSFLVGNPLLAMLAQSSRAFGQVMPTGVSAESS